MATFESISSRFDYIQGLYDEHYDEVVKVQQDASEDLIPLLTDELELTVSGVERVKKFLDDPEEAGELNFQNPTSMGEVQITQPEMLKCQLKDYQLKGLNWLANLYEQGINGILADEMGLGKTVQSISLMAYLAEVHNIWGPFLVIAPASTLHNWQQEVTRFVPGLKALPYWGDIKDRATLRKFWSRKNLVYDKDAEFHVIITSYQLVVQDEKYFSPVKWQYMILDEAQAIKSSGSMRWKTLLKFQCRNRLLLTGTPIQNSMQELWALLHFIMPQLFDSHDEFSEWFSKDIENNADNKGSMNEHQLRRLHMILKPFMLRRIKKNVQNELGDKIEIDLYCDLTARQRVMYNQVRSNVSISELVQRATSLSDDESVGRLMNLIMQFRKVCNHPELFERADVTAPLAFARCPTSSNITREGNFLMCPYVPHSVIDLQIPKLLYREGAVKIGSVGANDLEPAGWGHVDRLFNIWQPDAIHSSLKSPDSAFSFSRFADLSPSQISGAAIPHLAPRVSFLLERQEQKHSDAMLEMLSEDRRSTSMRPSTMALPFDPCWAEKGLVRLDRIEENVRSQSRLSRQDARFFIDRVVAPPPDMSCSDRSFAFNRESERFDPLVRLSLYGLPPQARESEEDVHQLGQRFPGLPPEGIIGKSSPEQLHFPPMQVPQLQKLIMDSGKLAKLDALLRQLKVEGHRVLVYFQMTKMIDLMEEYLAFRQYKYLRLDGSSSIEDRRDMVTDWQTRPDIFIFLLSTRAGGLGINLTAADTVVFYDSDWNPSNDQQAMDRAHRLGQTRQVTVYRLITKGTIDERIVNLARTKKNVQDAVVGSSSQAHITEIAQPNEVVSLLLGEEELEEQARAAAARRQRMEQKAVADGKRGAKIREENKKAKKSAPPKAPTSIAMDDDDDAFAFFAPQPTGGLRAGDDEEEISVAKASEAASNCPAKPTAKGKKRTSTAADLDDGPKDAAKKRAPKKKKGE